MYIANLNIFVSTNEVMFSYMLFGWLQDCAYTGIDFNVGRSEMAQERPIKFDCVSRYLGWIQNYWMLVEGVLLGFCFFSSTSAM